MALMNAGLLVGFWVFFVEPPNKKEQSSKSSTWKDRAHYRLIEKGGW